MKTVKQINDKLAALTSELKVERDRDTGAYKPNTVKRITKEIVFLRTVKLYLDTKPKSKVVNSQFDRLTRELNILNSRFDRWSMGVKKNNPNLTSPMLRKKYREDFNLKQLKNQLKFLIYILTDE